MAADQVGEAEAGHFLTSDTVPLSEVRTALAVPESSRSCALAPVAQEAQDYVLAARAAATLRAYRADWKHFEAWCTSHHLRALPATPETLALYLTAHAQQLRSATLRRRLSSISQAHQAAGLMSPTRSPEVRAVWSGIQRVHGVHQDGADPLLVDHLRQVVQALPPGMAGARDRALLLLGFAGAFRRSELVALDVSDVTAVPDGLRIRIRRSKTDQAGAGREVGIPRGTRESTCPVRALQEWLDRSGIEDEALFRPVDRHGRVGTGRLSDRAVALVVQRAARAVGLEGRLSGHSLRAGLATSAAAAGVTERVIMKQTGHRSERMLRRYIREGELFRENAAAAIL